MNGVRRDFYGQSLLEFVILGQIRFRFPKYTSFLHTLVEI